MATNGFDPATFDPYRALGVARAATAAQIKRAHRTLAKRYHPDAATGDTALFLAVHEAYRVLSDPLLRRAWDDRHAPGPVRADTPGPVRADTPGPVRADAPVTRASRKAPPRGRKTANERAAPRSAHSYRWSASEVPWWEEGAARQRRTRQPSAAKAEPHTAEPQTSADGRAPEPDFEVYNRSSGAAWSMAARAYFRKGDEDLPRRGQFHYQGTQVVTAGRARMARAEARRTEPPTVEPETAGNPAPAPPQRQQAAPARSAPPARAGMLSRLRRRLAGNR